MRTEREIRTITEKDIESKRAYGGKKLKRALVVLSGGQDSTTCLYWAKQLYKEVYALTFNYNQRHSIEVEAARKIVALAEVEWECLSLGPILKGTSPLVSEAVLEQYKDHHSLPGGLEKTFVPMRNQLFLTIAANRAIFHGANDIVTGVCEEDYGGYPDCRRQFIDSLEDAISLGLYGKQQRFLWETETPPLEIRTPLMKFTKKQTVELAMQFPGCYKALAYSHTSYDGLYPPTGHDHATLLRAKGFEQAGIPDPLILRAWQEGRMELPITPNYQFEEFDEEISKFMKLAGLW